MIEQRGKPARIRTPEVVEPPPVVLRLERQAAKLDTAIDVEHAISGISDGYTGPEEIGREDHGAIRQAKLRVLEGIAVRLALLALVAPREVDRQPARRS